MKPVQKAFIILVIIALSIPVVPLQSVISAPDPVVSTGVDPSAILVGAVKFRAFTEEVTPTTTTGVYLGIPKLNNKNYRSELDLQWTSQNAITFTYDVASDWLTAEVTNANGSWATTYDNFSAIVTDRVFGGDSTAANNALGGLNYLEVIIKLRKDQPTQLSLDDVHLIDEQLDNYSLGNFVGDKNKDSSEWMVTGHDISGGFVLTGTLNTDYVIGPDDLNNIMISFGYQDQTGPLTTNVLSTPNPVVVDTSMTVTATVDDTTTGGSQIASAQFSLDGGSTWADMQAVDGAFDEVAEDVTVSTTAPAPNGNYQLCVRGTDMSGNTGEMACITLFVTPIGDVEGPLTDLVNAAPNPVLESGALIVTASVDDTNTGGSQIASAQFSLDGGSTWADMQAVDGAFDEVAEDVTVSSTAPDTNGNYQLCVRGTDMSGNTGEMACVTLEVEVVDNEGPLVSDLAALPNPVVVDTSMTVTATVDDTTTGGSQIASAQFSLDGGSTWADMQAVDGDFDEVAEDVTVSSTAPDTPGSNQLCVRGTDLSGNTGEMACVTLEVEAEDNEGPLVSDLAALPNPVVVDTSMTVTATVDDTTTGGSQIASAQFSLDGGSTWADMQAVDGAFDEVAEDVTVSSTAPDTNGNYQLCVRGTDMSGNTGEMACVTLEVEAVDNEGPLVSDLAALPNPVVVDTSMTVTATVDDTTTGGSQIASAQFSLDGGSTWADMQAVDGDFDEVAEDVTVSSTAPDTPGSNQLCVRGTDLSGNTGEMACVTLEVEAEDNEGPLVSDLVALPNPVIIDHLFEVSAMIDESTTGSATIAGAEFKFDTGAWVAMDSQDGAFDEISEVATASLNAPNTPGDYTLCVRGSDALGNSGSAECITVSAYIPKIYLPIVLVATTVGE